MSLLSPLGAAAQEASVRQADARGLLRIAAGSLAQAREAAGEETAAPLRAAFGDAEGSIGRVEQALARRDEAFFHALSDGSRSVGRLRVAVARSGIAAPGLRRGMDDLSASYALLRSTYGWEAWRGQRGGPLTAEERQRFEALRRAHRRLADRLERIEERARRRGDDAGVQEADRLAREARRAAGAPPTLVAYLDASLLADRLIGEWAGQREAPERRLRADWEAAEPAVHEVEEVAAAVTEEETGFFFTANLGAAPSRGWLFAEAPVELAAGTEPGLDEGWLDDGRDSQRVEDAEPAEEEASEAEVPQEEVEAATSEPTEEELPADADGREEWSEGADADEADDDEADDDEADDDEADEGLAGDETVSDAELSPEELVLEAGREAPPGEDLEMVGEEDLEPAPDAELAEASEEGAELAPEEALAEEGSELAEEEALAEEGAELAPDGEPLSVEDLAPPASGIT